MPAQAEIVKQLNITNIVEYDLLVVATSYFLKLIS